MQALESLRERLPEYARDTRLNLQTVLQAESLTVAQRWGVALAAAAASRNRALHRAILQAAREQGLEPGVVEDALAAASLMAMNNVYYRFRHLIGKPEYGDKPARLRMNRIVRPSSNKPDFELFCLVVSAIAGRESCMRSHERVVLQGGLTEDQVHDAIRIASTIHAAAVSLEVAEAEL